MNNEGNRAAMGDQRRHPRLNLEGQLEYRYGSGETGVAAWRTVSAQGASIALGRYLRPGRHILLVAEIPWSGKRAEFKGRVVWCRPVGEDHRFEGGVAIYHDEPEIARVLAQLVAQAQFESTTCTLC